MSKNGLGRGRSAGGDARTGHAACRWRDDGIRSTSAPGMRRSIVAFPSRVVVRTTRQTNGGDRGLFLINLRCQGTIRRTRCRPPRLLAHERCDNRGPLDDRAGRYAARPCAEIERPLQAGVLDLSKRRTELACGPIGPSSVASVTTTIMPTLSSPNLPPATALRVK